MQLDELGVLARVSIVCLVPFVPEVNARLRLRLTEFGASSRQIEAVIDEVMEAVEKWAVPLD